MTLGLNIRGIYFDTVSILQVEYRFTQCQTYFVKIDDVSTC